MISKLLKITVCSFWFLTRLQAQCVVFQDKKGQVLTTCDFYGPTNQTLTDSHFQETYFGSPFLNFPVWQPGTIQLDSHSQELSCELAYNLETSEVMCRLAGDSTGKLISPEIFTTNGTRFVRQLIKLPGVKYNMYYSTLREGKTRLLERLTTHLEAVKNTGYYTDIRKRYQAQSMYYIQQGDAQPQVVELTKKSLLGVLQDQSAALAIPIPTGQLTPRLVIDLLGQYDSVRVASQDQLAQAGPKQLFSALLGAKLAYPGWVGKQGIYGRVYAGFSVDSLGQIGNVVLLSPDNMGFGLPNEVTKALASLPAVNPAFAGEYAIPVAFSYRSSKDKSGPHMPVNLLSADRLGNRILVDEVVISYVSSNSYTVSKEVWGYYK